MSRPAPGGIRNGKLPHRAAFFCAAFFCAVLCAGCISPATIGTVEFDTTNLALAEPPAAAEKPVEPLFVAARPLDDSTTPVLTFTAAQVREALSPVPEPQPSQPQSSSAAATPLAALPHIKTLQQISLDISVPGGNDMLVRIPPPTNYGAEALPLLAQQQPFVRGELIDYGYDVEPVPEGLELCYQPLYFQELNAERYGRSWGILQPAISMANFYGRVPLLPYMTFSRPARRCIWHAHWALPGYRIPEREPHRLIISPAGGAAQTAALFGLILLIP